MSDTKHTPAAAPPSESRNTSVGHTVGDSKAGGDGPRWPSAAGEIRDAARGAAQTRAGDRAMIVQAIAVHRRRMRELRGENR